MIRFADRWILFFLLLLPAMIFLKRLLSRSKTNSFRISEGSFLENTRPTHRIYCRKILVYLRALVLLFIILALARPQSIIEKRRIAAEGVDVILAVDVSSSMLAHDLKLDGERVSRLDVVKDVMVDFINRRPNDRIGVLAFAGYSYTVCPLTLDHDWLLNNIDRIKIGMIEDGTAIGSAVAGALNRLKGSDAKERVVILLTDGRNNAGRIAPLTAAEAAGVLGIRLYTIGVGTKGLAPFPVKDVFGNTVMRPVRIEVDEQLLEEMAEIAGGKYFWADSAEALEKVYAHIDELEKTEFEHAGYRQYSEFFSWPLFAAFVLLLLEILIANTAARGVP